MWLMASKRKWYSVVFDKPKHFQARKNSVLHLLLHQHFKTDMNREAGVLERNDHNDKRIFKPATWGSVVIFSKNSRLERETIAILRC